MKNALKELLPRRARLTAYVVAGAVALGVAAWQAAEGNWLVFTGSLAVAFTDALAAGNLPEKEETRG